LLAQRLELMLYESFGHHHFNSANELDTLALKYHLDILLPATALMEKRLPDEEDKQ